MTEFVEEIPDTANKVENDSDSENYIHFVSVDKMDYYTKYGEDSKEFSGKIQKERFTLEEN